ERTASTSAKPELHSEMLIGPIVPAFVSTGPAAAIPTAVTGPSPISATSRNSPAHAPHTSFRGTGTDRASSGVPSSAATAAASLVPPTSRANAVMATTLSDGSASAQDQYQVAGEELPD